MLGIFFFGLIYQKQEFLEKAIKKLIELMKSEPIRSKEFDFTITRYYEPEFGTNLKRLWCAFEETIPAERILEMKLKTMDLEQSLAQGGKRMINIDPGLVQMDRVILSTHKDAAHRIYLGKGIFAEITLIFEKKTFRPLPWTYPDYRWADAIQFFNSLREITNVSSFGRKKI